MEQIKKPSFQESEEKLKLPSDYAGPSIPTPVTEEALLQMIQYFKQDGQLPYRYAHRLFLNALQVLKKEPTVREINIPKGCRLTVVGDLHGQVLQPEL